MFIDIRYLIGRVVAMYFSSWSIGTITEIAGTMNTSQFSRLFLIRHSVSSPALSARFHFFPFMRGFPLVPSASSAQSTRVLGDVPPLVQTQPAEKIHSFCTRSKFIVYLFPPVLCLDHKYNTTNPETSNMQKPTIRIIGASGGSETNSISSNIRQSFSTSFAAAT